MGFVISRDEPGGLSPMRVGLASGGEALPVFGSRASAARYADGLGAGWRSRAVSEGDLVSLMSSVCRGVRAVLPDPVAGRETAPVERERFLGAWPSQTRPAEGVVGR
jgi:hypothetical protein